MSLGPSKRSILIKRFLPNFLVCGCLAVLTLSVYAPVTFSEFFDYDDGMYLGRNLHVQAGFTKESILWAFTNTETGLWHPLTWLSHMLDITLFGLKPFGHHLTNLFFHSMNAGMIFLVMKLFTRAWIPSFMIAILFSIHPLHVESVAWVSERKNVLSMFFFLLSLWAYFRLVKGGQKRWYAVLVLFFVLGLMSKPSLVTLPFVLLLLDFWPLRRIKIPILGENWSVLVKLIAEKWLLFFITLISCVEAVFAQQSQSAIVSLQSWPAEVRLSNALVSYMAYFGKALLPFNLMFIYPHPGGEIKFWIIFFSAGLLGGITWLVSVTYDKRPYMLIGWLWFLGTLFPMIGIVQIGQQAMADRYAYIPLIGLFIMAAFWFWSEVSAMDEKKQVFFFLASMSVVLLSLLTFCQTGHWKNSESLYRHALSVSEKNPIPRINLGNIRFAQGHWKEAIFHYSKVIELYPGHPGMYFNIGNALMRLNRLDEAEKQYLKALQLRRRYEEAYNNLGNLYARKRLWGQAEAQYIAAVRYNPEYVEAYKNLANVLVKQNKAQKAAKAYREVIRLSPQFADAHFRLGLLLAQARNNSEAIFHFIQAVAIQPRSAIFHYNLAIGLANHGNRQDAIRHLKVALEIDPGHELSRNAILKLVR